MFKDQRELKLADRHLPCICTDTYYAKTMVKSVTFTTDEIAEESIKIREN